MELPGSRPHAGRFQGLPDGEPIASKTASDIQMEDSPLPLQIGNWLGNDRPFNGAIKEFRVLKRSLGL